jgi:hypothetical protein
MPLVGGDAGPLSQEGLGRCKTRPKYAPTIRQEFCNQWTKHEAMEKVENVEKKKKTMKTMKTTTKRDQ